MLLPFQPGLLWDCRITLPGAVPCGGRNTGADWSQPQVTALGARRVSTALSPGLSIVCQTDPSFQGGDPLSKPIMVTPGPVGMIDSGAEGLS